jgi:glycosyltransferase involved in cell wall biosynthesis
LPQKHHILWLNTWFPDREDPYLGIFIQRQAEALASVCTDIPVWCLYIRPLKGITKTETDWIVNNNYNQLCYYYPDNHPNWVRKVMRIYHSAKALQIIYQKGCRPTWIQVNVTGPWAIIAVLLKVIFQAKLFWFEHWSGFLPEDGRYLQGETRWNTWILKTFADGIGAVSNLLAASLPKAKHPNQVEIISNVVDPAFFIPSLRRPNPELPHRFAHISNYVPIKNTQKILDALLILSSRTTDFKFIFYGKPVKQKEDLERQVRLAGLSSCIAFVPELPAPELAEEMQGLTALVQFSIHETQGVVILEAWSMGIPVILTPKTGAGYYGKPGRSWCISPDDPQALANLLEEIILNKQRTDNPEEMAQFAYENFSPSIIGQKFLNWYKSFKA